MCQLLLLFVAVPIVEMYLLIRIGEAIGWPPTLALVLVTGVLGATLARRQGLSALRRIQEETAAGRVPGDALFDGALILVAGAVLITPGVLTDVFGFLCLVPAFRRMLRRRLSERFATAVREGRVSFTVTTLGTPPPFSGGGGVREVEHEDLESRPVDHEEVERRRLE